MIEIDAARRLVAELARPLPAAEQPAGQLALGQILAEGVAADADSPPFAKSLRDGFAVRAADLLNGAGELRVVGEVMAGGAFAGAVGPGEAVAIATGAPIPAGADAVVMVELTRREGGRVRIVDAGVRPGQHVFPQGGEMRAGEVILPAGTAVTPVVLAMLAAVGRTTALVRPVPRVAILPTGSELREPGEPLAAGMIRNTNGPLLTGLVRMAHAEPIELGTVGDDAAALRDRIEAGLASADVLILSGGVSVGPLDLVPKVLADAGVTTHFHRVRAKPGQPVLFGSRGDQLVFGLPGNPGGVLVAFTLFVRPALDLLAGRAPADLPAGERPLAGPFATANDRPTFHPAALESGVVRPLKWGGSADLRTFVAADVLIVLPAGEVRLPAGAMVPVVSIGGGRL